MGDNAMLNPEDQHMLNAEDQHLRALELANRVRLARARLKRRIAAGELSAGEVVSSCPWEAHSMSISDLLMSQKRWGLARCRRVLVALGVPENKRVGTLTDRQRAALVAQLGETAQPAPAHGAARRQRALQVA